MAVQARSTVLSYEGSESRLPRCNTPRDVWKDEDLNSLNSLTVYVPGKPARKAVRRASSPLTPGVSRGATPLTLLPGLTLFADAETGGELSAGEMAAARGALHGGAAP